jgi:GNAT superfamily N-acetyltransferase
VSLCACACADEPQLPVLSDDAAGSHTSTVAGIKPDDSGKPQAAAPATAGSGFSLSSNSLVSKITGRLSVFNDGSGPQLSSETRRRGKSYNVVQPGAPVPAEYANPGASVVGMSSSYFKAITRDEALQTFWASDDTGNDVSLDYLRATHSVQWFIEFGDMFLISLNGKGTIDGYLMGFVSGRTPDHAIVHQVGVVPSVRRKGVATKLYARFRQLAQDRGCHFVRVLVPRSRPGAIAFHRAFGFEELPEDSERIKGFNGADISVFILPVEGEGVIVSR